MTPSRTAELPDIPLSQLVRPVVIAASGRPSSRNINRPTASEANSGMIDDRHQAAEPLRHVDPADPQRCETGDQTADDAADEAGADEDGDRACGEAGCDAGPVGDRERDVTGQCGHQEPEGQPPRVNNTAPRYCVRSRRAAGSSASWCSA